MNVKRLLEARKRMIVIDSVEGLIVHAAINDRVISLTVSYIKLKTIFQVDNPKVFQDG